MRKTKTHILTTLAFQLNGVAGTGNYEHITIERVKQEIETGGIFGFLRSELSDLDLSLLGPAEQEEFEQEWATLTAVADESRKFYVKRGGLNLLVAYLLEGIQVRSGGQS